MTEPNYQQEIDSLLERQDVSEVIAHAISHIISGRIVQYQMSVGGPVNCDHDPACDVDFGERLLCSAIDKLRQR